MYAIKTDYNGVAVLSLKGKLVTTDDIERLQADVKESLKTKPKEVIINLRHLNWISSTGISGIIRCLSITKKAGSRLALTGLNDKVKSILVLTKMDKVVNIFPTVKDALEKQS